MENEHGYIVSIIKKLNEHTVDPKITQGNKDTRVEKPNSPDDSDELYEHQEFISKMNPMFDS